MRLAFVLCVVVLTCVAAPVAFGENVTTQSYQDLVGNHPSAIALARALDVRLTVDVNDAGVRTHVWHCRASAGGCRARIAAMARLITDTSNAFGVDPFLTAAMAFRESRLNPLALGPVGERGIVQLHPVYRGKTVPFVYDEAYRERCAAQRPGACQREVLDAGLALFRWAVRKCGNIDRGLGWYNSGHCDRTFYSRAVLRERRKLLRTAKKIDPSLKSVFSN